jgi:methionyl aminopeptidase
MLNMGTHLTKTLADKWTVVTMDGRPSVHVEHTVAITENGPDVLTRFAVEMSQSQQLMEVGA